jgi:ribonuclease HII
MKSTPKRIFEYEARRKGHFICGIDEAGRGCLAGPVVVAAVSLKRFPTSVVINDSKLMSPVLREKAYDYIIRNSFWTACVADQYSIEQLNIYRATQQSMYRVIDQLQLLVGKKLDHILVDAMPLTKLAQVTSMIEGESRSLSIAAASVVAKVTRDRLMCRYAQSFPGYRFNAHKGYATPDHYAQLDAQGQSIVHRPHFLRTWYERGMSPDEQLSLFDIFTQAEQYNESI